MRQPRKSEWLELLQSDGKKNNIICSISIQENVEDQERRWTEALTSSNIFRSVAKGSIIVSIPLQGFDFFKAFFYYDYERA